MEKKVIKGFPIISKGQFKVYIKTITYNHAPYIEDCLNGVVSQKTSFPFIRHVVDDCSTDGEQKVIRTYIANNCDTGTTVYYDNEICEVIFSKSVNNPNCYYAIYLLKHNMFNNPQKYSLYTRFIDNCQYGANCEGDDYWHDEYKLSQQVAYLDSNSSIDLTFTDFDMYIESNKKRFESAFKNGHVRLCQSFEEELVNAGYITPPSWVYRLSNPIFSDYQCEGFIDSSFFWALECFKQNKVRYIPDSTCTYRRLEESASHSKSLDKQINYIRDVHREQLYFAKKYEVSEDLLFQIDLNYYTRRRELLISYNDPEDIKNVRYYLNKSDVANKNFLLLMTSNQLGLLLLRIYYKHYIRKTLKKIYLFAFKNNV